MRFTAILLTLGMCLASTAAAQIVINVGPVYVPPGAGTEVFSGDAATAGGATISQTGYDLGQTAALYFGVRADTYLNGYSMDGPGITGDEIFRYLSHTPNSIVYSGETMMVTTSQGSHVTPTRMTFTFTGTGTVIYDATTQGLNDLLNGDVAALWHVQSGDFSVNVLIEAQVPPFDPNAGNFEPANDLFNRIETEHSTATSFDWAFYYAALGAIFSDDFESGDTTAWGNAVP